MEEGRSLEDALAEVREALSALEGLEAQDCDGMGHPIPDALACVHVRCSLPSPRREETLGRLGPLVRRARFVMAALVDRRDLYSVSLPTDARRRDPVEAIHKLLGLLRDPERLEDGIVPDRRGRA